MRIFYLILLVFAAISFNADAQGLQNKPVAKIGDMIIDDQEFLLRYEMTPTVNKHRKSTIESQKMEFLFSLIAEKLWALEAIDRRMDTTEVIKFATESFERLFVRDALFQKEIKDKISISDLELNFGVLKNRQNLYVNFLFSEDVEEINQLYKLLVGGVSFDSILAESPELIEQKTPVEVLFGQMEESVEDILYNLNIGDYTQPVLTADGWYIFRLVNKSDKMFTGSERSEDIIKNVKKTLEARKLIERQKEFYFEFFKGKTVEVNPDLFEWLAQNISRIFEYKKFNYAISDSELIHLDAKDILKIEEAAGNENLGTYFINLDKNPISFKEYLRTLIFDGYNNRQYRINIIRASLDDRIKKDIEKELLYREGLRRGYENLPEVRRDVQIWRNNYLFQMVKDQYRDSISVTEEELYAYYQKNNKPESTPMLVNIVEVFTDSIEVVEIILSKINSGVEIKEVAKEFNKREWTKKRDGEYGLFPITMYGEIGRIASGMNVGDVYGPLKIDNGYSIFKLIDKQDEKVIPPKPFEKFRDQYKQDLTFQKLQNRITDFTYNLSQKYKIQLDLNKLEEINVTNFPSFGIRYLGFGGKITAVPLISPNVDWVEKWIKNQQPPMVP